jgi:hypothetical protein
MVPVRYTGVSNPREAFEALRPAHDALLKMMIKCRPSGTDYLVLLAAKDALKTAAQHFTGDRHIYGGSHKGQP